MALVKTVMIITNIPTPYRIPLFNELCLQLHDIGYTLKVIFGSLGYQHRKWQINMSDCAFEYEVLNSKEITLDRPENTTFNYPNLYEVVKRVDPTAIITNGFSIATTKLWFRSFVKATPYIIWSGTVPNKNNEPKLHRKIHRKLLTGRASSFVAYGTKAKQYLQSLGAKEEKVEIAINTVDTRFFSSETAKLRLNQKQSETEKKRLLYIGHLSSRKNVSKLLKVVKELSSQRSDFLLDLVGDGEDRSNLENYVRDHHLSEFVVFHGFKQKTDMPAFLAQSICFLFQTDFDIWGLVLVEAMAAGLPCLASVSAGATQDLIDDNKTGFIADFSNLEDVKKKINWILDNPKQANEIGQRASEFISNKVSLKKSAEGFIQAITSIPPR